MQTFFLDMKDGVPLRDGSEPDTPLNRPFRSYLLGLPRRHERDKTAHWQLWNRLKGRLNGCEFSVPTTTASTLQA